MIKNYVRLIVLGHKFSIYFPMTGVNRVPATLANALISGSKSLQIENIFSEQKHKCILRKPSFKK